MRTERAQATREHLLEVATRLFAERGYEATSIEQVLREAGVSRGALYHHFSSKESLFEAVYAAAQARVAKDVIEDAVGAGSPLEMIKAGTRSWLYRIRDTIVRQITLIDAPSVLGWQKWREIDEQHFLGTIKDALSKATGGALPPERVDFLSHLLLGMLGEAAMQIARGEQSDEAIDEAAEVVDDLLTRLLA